LFRLQPLLAFLALAGLASSVQAVEIKTGNEDVVIHWDTTAKASFGWRVDRIDPLIGNSVTGHQSDYKFPDRGDMWQKRIDILTEMDVVFKGNYGARVSAAGWYDAAYNNLDYVSNPNLTAFRAHSGKYDAETRRFYHGPSGEILDAFAFGTFDLGGREVSVKLGQHSLVWGVSMVSLGESLSWSQQPSNLRKAAEIPGSSPKEVAMPLTQLSFQSEIVPKLSVAGYYQMDWKRNRLSEGGTFLGAADMLWGTSGGVPVAPNVTIPMTAPVLPSDNSGRNYGVQLSASPDWLAGGNVSLVYRRFDEKQPWALLADSAYFTGFHNSYARDVEIFGAASNFALAGLSIGVEMNYTKDGALVSQGVGRDGARGDTWHALANGQRLVGATPFWDSGVLVAELGYTRLAKVSSRADMYSGVGYACAGGAAAGCATKDTWTGSLMFMPTWFNAPIPGMNLTGSLILAGYGLSGNTPNLVGGKKGSYSYSVGMAADYLNRYKISLQYSDSEAKKSEATTDRGRVSLSFATTF
jgi:hypothetical protein